MVAATKPLPITTHEMDIAHRFEFNYTKTMWTYCIVAFVQCLCRVRCSWHIYCSQSASHSALNPSQCTDWNSYSSSWDRGVSILLNRAPTIPATEHVMILYWPVRRVVLFLISLVSESHTYTLHMTFRMHYLDSNIFFKYLLWIHIFTNFLQLSIYYIFWVNYYVCLVIDCRPGFDASLLTGSKLLSN